MKYFILRFIYFWFMIMIDYYQCPNLLIEKSKVWIFEYK